jgi:hypothetical protein
MTKLPSPFSVRAATTTKSAVWPSITTGLVPSSCQRPDLRLARVRMRSITSPCPCSSMATLPRLRPAARSASRSSSPSARHARVASTAEEK